MNSLSWQKKICVVFIIIIVSYLLIRFLNTQKKIYEYQMNVLNTREGYDNKNNINFMKINDSGPQTKNINITENPNLTLKDYVIKSSYNTAYIGSSMSLDAISYALSRGYRFLDFEVYLVDGLPCVGYCGNPNSNVISSSNTLGLGQVFYNIINNAFTAPTPNTSDPLFINLRIKSTNTQLYELVAKAIDNNMNNKLYKGTVDLNTKMSDILGKIVLIVDTTVAPNYDSYPVCPVASNPSTPCYNLSKYINLEGGSNNLRLVTYDNLLKQTTTPPNINSTDGTTDLTVLKISYPDVSSKAENPVLESFITEYGTQFVAVRLYILDTNLKKYESFFANSGYAFVPYSMAIKNI